MFRARVLSIVPTPHAAGPAARTDLDEIAALPHAPALHPSQVARRVRLLAQQIGVLLAGLLWAWLLLAADLKPPQLGLSWLPADMNGLLWAPAAVSLVALCLWGPRLLPALWLSQFATAYLMQIPPALAAGLAATQLAGSWVAAQGLHAGGFQSRLQRRRDVAQWLTLAGLGGSGLSALLSCLLLQFSGVMPEHGAWPALLLSALSQGLGVVSLAPLLFHLAHALPNPTQAGEPGTRRWPAAPGLLPPSRHWKRLALSGALALSCLALHAALLQQNHGLDASSLGLMLANLLVVSLLALVNSRGWLAAALLPLMLGSLSLSWAQGWGPLQGLTAFELCAVMAAEGLALGLLPALLQAQNLETRSERHHWQGLLAATGMGLAEWRLERSAQGARGLDVSHQACPTWRRYTGAAAAQDAAAWPSDWLAISHPLDRERCRQALEGLLPPGGPDEFIASLRLPSLGGEPGLWHWYELKGSVQARDPQGHALRLLTLLRDINWQHQAEERQRMSVALFQHLHEGLAVTDTEDRLLDANPSFCRMLGHSREALVGQTAPPLQIQVLRQSGHSPEQLQLALQSEGFWQGRVHAQRADGSPCHLQLTVSTIPEPDGPLRYRVLTMSDLTLALQQQDRLDRQSRFDPLTGLPNHDEFMRLLQGGLEASERDGFHLSICRLDLDQFKRINAEHGPDRADLLLLQVAERLQGALRSSAQWSDVVARLGGDEFALLLRAKNQDESEQALERLLAVVSQPYKLAASQPGQADTLILDLSASMGATLYPQDDSDAETLMRHAGHALYRVKHTGRNGYRLFDTAKRLRNEASLIALARVQQALDASELQLYFQPKIDMQTGQVLGMEALLRWQHPERGLLGPAHFLPLIEPTGLGVQVGDWVMEQALKHSEQWLAEGLGLNISVNVTARQLQMPEFAQRLQELLQRHSEPVARHLSLEVLESAALADINATQALIKRCRGYGVSFALDDFGTGYSTLTYLQRLPVDALKIDRSFVQNMLINSQDSALVEGVIGLAHNFGCSVVAEGVETAAHARALLRLGCIQGQGNGIAEAMPAAEVAAWVRAFPQSGWMQALRAREAAGATVTPGAARGLP